MSVTDLLENHPAVLQCIHFLSPLVDYFTEKGGAICACAYVLWQENREALLLPFAVYRLCLCLCARVGGHGWWNVNSARLKGEAVWQLLLFAVVFLNDERVTSFNPAVEKSLFWFLYFQPERFSFLFSLRFSFSIAETISLFLMLVSATLILRKNYKNTFIRIHLLLFTHMDHFLVQLYQLWI